MHLRTAPLDIPPSFRYEELSAKINVNERIFSRLDSWSDTRWDSTESRWRKLNGGLPEKFHALALVPMAINEEDSENLTTLLELYAAQDMPHDQWGVILSLNCVGAPDPRRLKNALQIIEMYRRESGLFIAASVISYDEPRSIGGIRSDLWDLGLMSVVAHEIDHIVAAFSNDVDMRYIHGSYISQGHRAVLANPRACYNPMTRFDISTVGQPVVRELLDFTNFRLSLHGRFGIGTTYENNLIMNIAQYADADSWGDDKVAEIKALLGGLNRAQHRRSIYSLPEFPLEEQPHGLLTFLDNQCNAVRVSCRRDLQLLLDYYNQHKKGNEYVFDYGFTTNGEDTVRHIPERSLGNLALIEIETDVARKWMLEHFNMTMGNIEWVDPYVMREVTAEAMCRVARVRQ